MGKTLEIIEKPALKRRKNNLSKNKKKSWRKIDLKDTELFLQQKEEDDRLGVLGEESENLFFFEHDANEEVDQEKVDAAPVRYTVDVTTGLKDTGCKKKEKQQKKTVHGHRFLNGLPGKKPINRESAFRKEHTKEFADTKYREKLARNPKLAARILARQVIDANTARNSKVLGKKLKRMMPEAGPWDEPEPITDYGAKFIAPEVDFTLVTIKKKLVARKGMRNAPSNVPALRIPDPGMSYQPTHAEYQRLLQTAATTESRRINKSRKESAVKSTNFPLGALPANELQTIEDMAPQDGASEDVNTEVDLDKEPAPLVRKPGRLTHQQDMKKKKKSERRQDDAKVDRAKTKRRQWAHLDDFKGELKSEAVTTKRRKVAKKNRLEHAKNLPARFFKDGGVEVALPDELSTSLRTIQTTSNPVGAAYEHIFRRGLLPGKPNSRGRVGRSALRLPGTRKMRAKTVDGFKAQDFGIKL